MERQQSDEFSVLVVASDLGIDGRSLLSPSDRLAAADDGGDEEWHDCQDDDFTDLETLQILRLQGSDKRGHRILRIVGKYFPG